MGRRRGFVIPTALVGRRCRRRALLQRISLVLMVISVVIYFWGFRLLRLIVVPLTLLLLAIPIPQILFNRIAFPLQLFASRCAVAAMSFFSIPVLRQGNIIELMPLGATEPKKLAVVEACSGIRSLMTLVTLAVVYAYFTKPKNDHQDSNDDQVVRQGYRAIMLLPEPADSLFSRVSPFGDL